ncbi:hypothetical protein BOW53_05600 [Solemya pervernicosa gill symbiont]|uniref:Hemerythrin family protein n=2 Tax=Gammaproteobacteria incertae sedis TaxID=118884 RepID=A0A1T2L7B7_9GAMM|nr:hypothetical protein [Candidatus Reidiella endopervernicosa]OOZ40997.1 hypothetical protein BOW53_05600 [Solemya pervernicosa gill symbiont]QKQ25054.1 hypothetical protein HUE57_01190 [Candidatus Reidiella endopervernicosa]
MAKKGKIQQAVVITAYINYLLAIGCMVLSYVKYQEHGSEHPVTAAFMASVVFFVGVGIVLHVIGRTNLPSLKVIPGE